MQEYKGTVTISHVRDAQSGHTWVELRIAEKNCGVEFCTVRVELKDFTEAIFGHGYRDCDIAMHGLDVLGLESQNKEEIIAGNPYTYKGKQAMLKAIVALEKDGWIASRKDIENHHNFVRPAPGGADGYRVTFFRYVKPSGPPNPTLPLDARVKLLCEAGKVIEAIKLVRSVKDMGLKESKDYVDNLRGWKP